MPFIQGVSVSDPVGSVSLSQIRPESTSGKVDPDPGSIRKIVINSQKINQNYKNIIFFFKKSLFCSINMNNKIINYNKKHLYEYYIFYRKKFRKK